MSAEITVRSALVGYAALSAAIGQRIYPDAITEGEPYPSIVYSRTGTEPIRTIHGTKAGEFVDIDVQAWAKTRADADSVAAMAEAGLEAAGIEVSSRSAGFDPETALYVTSLGVRLFDA